MTYPNGYAGDLDVESMAAELRLAQRQRDEAVTSIMDLSSQLATANNSLDTFRQTLEETRTQLNESRARHKSDITLIGDTLLEATEEYPEGYDDNVDFLNGRIRYELPTRNREYTVRYRVDVTFTVNATSVENAEDETRSDMRRIESTIDNFSLYNASAVTSSVEYDDADIEINDSF
jgi:chromosome segregation ATPase